MDEARENSVVVASLSLLGMVVALACVLTIGAIAVLVFLEVGKPAPIVTLVDSLALNLKSARTIDVAGDGRICRSCGVVEQVRELDPAVSRHEFSTVAGGGVEGIAVILGALGGKFRLDQSPIYEVAVRMQDGSVRVLRTAMPPACKPGDRVRVVMGRIAPV